MVRRRPDQPIQVLVVEARRARRALLLELLHGDGRFAVAGTAADGAAALEAALRLRPDIIMMDVQLPALDGCEAARMIMQRCPTPIVLISGSAEEAQRRSVEALSSGALAVVRAPDRRASDHAQLLTTLRLMADVPVVTRHAARWPAAAGQPGDEAPVCAPASGGPAARRTARRMPRSIAGPPTAGLAPQVLAIAASTGGPAALQVLLGGIGAALAHSAAQAHPRAAPPILIAQHISRGFVQALAGWLERTTSLPVHVACDEQRLLPGHVYLASDGQHLLAGPAGAARLQPGAEHDRYCPSADALFESVALIYGARAIGVVLTGMGDDGARGLRALRMAGGRTFAQDEASSVVYGMPGAAVAAGAVAQVVPLAGLAEVILRALDCSPYSE